jgi:hypothetical protein
MTERDMIGIERIKTFRIKRSGSNMIAGYPTYFEPVVSKKDYDKIEQELKEEKIRSNQERFNVQTLSNDLKRKEQQLAEKEKQIAELISDMKQNQISWKCGICINGIEEKILKKPELERAGKNEKRKG